VTALLQLPVIDRPAADLSAFDIAALQAEIRSLAQLRNATILAHNYQRPEIQDVADVVGDSLALARAGAASPSPVLVLCGVEFMAESAAILSPSKTVLLPDLAAGCSLASSITADELRRWKAQYPGAVVVAYVNTTAAVKAEADYCCTSGNARAVIEAIPADREILFLPDVNLGLWLQQVTGRKLHIWMGECHVHAGIRPDELTARVEADPSAEFLVHPECGCASRAMAFGGERMRILSTEGMIRFASASPAEKFVVATEVGILHRLRGSLPDRRFEPLSEEAVCAFMKLITLEKVRDSLRDMVHPITVAPDIAERARAAVERMVAIG
jgi:quinolinate synthase